MRRFCYILTIAMMVVFGALSASAQVGRVNKPKQSTKPSTSNVKKNSGSSRSRTTKAGPSHRPSSSSAASSSRSRSNSNTGESSSSTSSSVVSVTINCNAEATDVYIDNSYYGVAGNSFNIKTGTHKVQLVAEGYEDFTNDFTVTGSSRTFNFTMKRKALQSISDLMDDMVFVHGGAFTMGSKGLDAEFDEKPAHEVILPSFYICKHEVTQQLWMDVMGGNPSAHLGELNPVESVSWEDCQLFISRLNDLTGLKFRLPTEAEWEYAARGGNESKGFLYAGSDSINDVAWCAAYDSGPQPVGEKMPNELGLYDMSGNVMEWCADWHGPYNAGRQKNPSGAQTGEYRIARGGYWECDPRHCTVTYRYPIPPEEVSEFIGMRLVAKTLKTKRSSK